MPWTRSYKIPEEYKTIHVQGWTFDEFGRIFSYPVSPANPKCALDTGGGSVTFHRAYMPKNPAWFGGLSNFDDVTKMLTTGWPEGGERIKALSKELSANLPRIKDRKRRTTRAETGDELVIDAALQGNWEHAWVSSVRTWTDGPASIDVYAEFGGNADCSSEQLFWSGAAAAVASDILEDAGYSTRIVGVSVCRAGARDYAFQYAQILLKDFDEPLRRDVVASVLCHAAVFRTYGFRMLSCHPAYLDPEGLGHMVPINTIEKDLRSLGELDSNALYVKSSRDKKQCIKQIKTALAPFLEVE